VAAPSESAAFADLRYFDSTCLYRCWSFFVTEGWTFSIACSKCFFVIFFVLMFSRSASIAASRASDSMSAPVYPSVSSASLFRFTDLSKTLFSSIFFVWIFRICNLPAFSGTGTYTILSNRPGRIRAGSRMSGLFVAPITITFVKSSIPSISAKS